MGQSRETRVFHRLHRSSYCVGCPGRRASVLKVDKVGMQIFVTLIGVVIIMSFTTSSRQPAVVPDRVRMTVITGEAPRHLCKSF